MMNAMKTAFMLLIFSSLAYGQVIPPPSGGGSVSLTATAPIVVTPSPTTGTGVISATTLGSGSALATTNNAITFAGTDATTMTFPSTSATVAGLGIVQTFTAAQTNSTAGAASTSAMQFTGTPFAGTGTTSFPLVYINNGAAPTTFGTTGTYLGINGASGFSGNYIDVHTNGGGTIFRINNVGTVVTTGNVTANSGIVSGAAYASASNCSINSVSPGACGSAAAGKFVVPTTTGTYTVNTSAVSASSEIFLMPRTDSSEFSGSPTCVVPTITAEPVISAIVASTSFTLTMTSTSGQTCWTYLIIN